MKMVAPIRSSVFFMLTVVACTPQGDPSIAEAFEDNFDRAQIGPNYNRTGGNWRIVNGELRIQGAKNHPLWLRQALPRDVEVTFDVRSESPEGDIKVELFGDGVSKAKAASYTATSYVVIFGGWNNSLNVIARMNEHGDDRIVGPKLPVVQGKRYTMRIVRRGRELSAWVDGKKLGTMNDPNPLWGRGHKFFAFNNWNSELYFDNLKIKPL